MPHKRVLVKWVDSRGLTEGWQFIEDLEPITPSEITSVGYLFEDNDEYIVIAQSLSDDQALGRMAIPKGCITNVIELRVK